MTGVQPSAPIERAGLAPSSPPPTEASTPRPWSVELEATFLRRGQAMLSNAAAEPDAGKRRVLLAEARITLAQSHVSCPFTLAALDAAEGAEVARLLREEGPDHG